MPLHLMDGIALLEMPICRHAFRKVFARVVLALFSRVELGNGAMIAHDARPDFARLALGVVEGARMFEGNGLREIVHRALLGGSGGFRRPRARRVFSR